MRAAIDRRFVVLAALCALFALGGWALGRWQPNSAPARDAGINGEAPHRLASAPAVAAAPAAASATPARCAFAPLLPARGQRDGQFQLEAALGQPDRPSAAAFVAVATEAVGQDRLRDAEVALIAACRVAAAAAPGPSQPLADVEARLGQLYADAAHADPEVRLRARELLAASHAGYEAVLGPHASRTRIAAQWLESVQPHRAPEVAAAMGAAPARVEEPADADAAVAEDCTRAVSVVQRIVCGDRELARMESDMRRLRAQAASVTRDPAGLRQRADQAVAQREARCRDRACLVRWYAQRRAQLLDEF